MSEKPSDEKSNFHKDDEPKTPTKKDLKSLASEDTTRTSSPLKRMGNFLRKSMKFKGSEDGSSSEKVQCNRMRVYIKMIPFDNELNQNSDRESAATAKMNQGNQQNGIKTSQCGRTPPNTPAESVNGMADPYRNAWNANQLTSQNQNRVMCRADLNTRLEYLGGDSNESTTSATSSYSSSGMYSSTESSDPNSMFSPCKKRQPVRRKLYPTYKSSSNIEWEESSTSSDESLYRSKK